MTHAPGPWRFDHDWGRIPTIFDAEGNKVASVEKIGGAKRTPEQEASAKLIEAAPDLLKELVAVRSIISEAAMTGFNCHEGDWAERLFKSQGPSSEAVKKAGGNPCSVTPEQH